MDSTARHSAAAGSPSRIAVASLTLSDFRCYDDARIEPDGANVVLHGANGAGKTNLLEAVSFLAPGRGLRGAKLAEVTRTDAGHPSGHAVRHLAARAA
ncbi:MAG: AAA family ATPase, partial [Proteobacteria bacterium]|nr:AAA family ATPase [Pseudomonadota bacterium]